MIWIYNNDFCEAYLVYEHTIIIVGISDLFERQQVVALESVDGQRLEGSVCGNGRLRGLELPVPVNFHHVVGIIGGEGLLEEAEVVLARSGQRYVLLNVPVLADVPLQVDVLPVAQGPVQRHQVEMEAAPPGRSQQVLADRRHRQIKRAI